jgi:protocatechuate 3,4-dioxygenase alpha subunit
MPRRLKLEFDHLGEIIFMDLVPTPSQTAGPFFHLGMTNTRSVPRIAGPQTKGERVWLTCRVLDGEDVPVCDAMIEIWQADAEGMYNHPDQMREDAGAATEDSLWLGFGRMPTGLDGCCEFETIKPGRVPGSGSVRQAPHLNVAIFARGMLKQLYTRIYFSGDPSNSEDAVLALVPPARCQTLVAQPDASHLGHWRFDIHLQGDLETVFFDV